MGGGIPGAQHGGGDSGGGGCMRNNLPLWDPQVLDSDQGRTFEGRVMKELAQTLGMDKRRTTPYHPQANGQVERFYCMLAAMLATVVAVDQSDWDQHLPFLTGAYPATPHPAMGHSPSFMMFR